MTIHINCAQTGYLYAKGICSWISEGNEIKRWISVKICIRSLIMTSEVFPKTVSTDQTQANLWKPFHTLRYYKCALLTAGPYGSRRNVVRAQRVSVQVELPFQPLSHCILVYWVRRLPDAFLELPADAELNHHAARAIGIKCKINKHEQHQVDVPSLWWSCYLS